MRSPGFYLNFPKDGLREQPVESNGYGVQLPFSGSLAEGREIDSVYGKVSEQAGSLPIERGVDIILEECAFVGRIVERDALDEGINPCWFTFVANFCAFVFIHCNVRSTIRVNLLYVFLSSFSQIKAKFSKCAIQAPKDSSHPFCKPFASG